MIISARMAGRYNFSKTKSLQSEQTDPKVIKELQMVADKIQCDLDNNLITEDF